MTKNIGFMVLGAIIILAGVAYYMQMQKTSMDGREGTEKLSADQVVGLEVQADVQNNR
jgi:hypothetical protein